MTEGAEVNPQQKFEAGVNRALTYGKVFIQDIAVSNSQDAANQVKTASQEGNKWLGVLFPSLKMSVISEEEASVARKISVLLTSLSNTAEGS